jgi:fluoroacetyl-CoA thioesterase
MEVDGPFAGRGVQSSPMKPTLAVGVTATHAYAVTAANTVPHLAMDRSTFDDIPEVLATAYMCVMMEGACTKALKPHLDAGEGSLGIHLNVSHVSPTLPGQTVTVTATIERIEGRKVTFHVIAHDGLDKIGEGTHQRAIVPWQRFKAGVVAKAARVTNQ